MPELDLPNKFLRQLYKFVDENDLEVKDDELWTLAKRLSLIANPRKFSTEYNNRKFKK